MNLRKLQKDFLDKKVGFLRWVFVRISEENSLIFEKCMQKNFLDKNRGVLQIFFQALLAQKAAKKLERVDLRVLL